MEQVHDASVDRFIAAGIVVHRHCGIACGNSYHFGRSACSSLIGNSIVLQDIMQAQDMFMDKSGIDRIKHCSRGIVCDLPVIRNCARYAVVDDSDIRNTEFCFTDDIVLEEML